MIRSLDGDTDFFDIGVGVLQGNRTSIDLIKNSFLLENARSRVYSAKPMSDTDYRDDLTLLSEYQLHNVE